MNILRLNTFVALFLLSTFSAFAQTGITGQPTGPGATYACLGSCPFFLVCSPLAPGHHGNFLPDQEANRRGVAGDGVET